LFPREHAPTVEVGTTGACSLGGLKGLSAIASRRRTHNHKWFCKYGSLFDPEIYETAICNVRSRTGRRRKVPGLVNSGNQEPHNLTAVSKGGILWPLFTDIYFSDFDVWLQDLSSSLERQLLKGGNKLRKGIERGIQGGGTRIHYIRYGDQWLVGVDGPKSVAVEIKDDIAMYLNMNLKLNIENDDIAITHLATEKCKYLGMLISTRDRKYTESLVGESADYAYGQIVLEAPINELVTKLVERGFAVNPEYPRGMSGWIHLEAEEIMRRYRSIIRSLMNYYSIVDNKNMLRRVFWILRFSAIFTLCRKWRMSTRALFKKLATDPKYADFLKGRVASSKW